MSETPELLERLLSTPSPSGYDAPAAGSGARRARGDELATRDGRRAQIRAAKGRLDERRAAEPAPIPRGRSGRLELCRARLVEDWRTERRANRDYEAYPTRGVMRDGRRFGVAPKPLRAAREAPRDDQRGRPRLAHIRIDVVGVEHPPEEVVTNKPDALNMSPADFFPSARPPYDGGGECTWSE